MTAHGKTHAAYLALKAEHPDWRDVKLAKELGVTRQAIGYFKQLERPSIVPAKLRMLDWILSGHSDCEVAEEFGITAVYVKRIRNALGIKYKAGRPPKITRDDILPFLREHPDMIAEDIAILFGTTAGYINGLRSHHGISGRVGRPRKITKS